MRNVITSYKKLPLDVKKAMKRDYPFGLEEELTSIKNILTGTYFEGLMYSYNETLYLVKIQADTPVISSEEDLGDAPTKDEDSFEDDYDD